MFFGRRFPCLLGVPLLAGFALSAGGGPAAGEDWSEPSMVHAIDKLSYKGGHTEILAFEPTPDGELFLLSSSGFDQEQRILWRRSTGGQKAWTEARSWLEREPWHPNGAVALTRTGDDLHLVALEFNKPGDQRLHCFRWPLSADAPDREQRDVVRLQFPDFAIRGAAFAPAVDEAGRAAADPALLLELEERKPGSAVKPYTLVFLRKDAAYRQVSRLDEAAGIDWWRNWRTVRFEGREALLAGCGQEGAGRLLEVRGESLVCRALPLPEASQASRTFGAGLLSGDGWDLGVFAQMTNSQPTVAFFATRRARGAEGGPSAWDAPVELTRTDPGHMGPDERLGRIEAAAVGERVLVGLNHLRLVGFENNETWAKVFETLDRGRTWRDTHLVPDKPGESTSLRLLALPRRKEFVAAYVASRLDRAPARTGIDPQTTVLGIVLRRMAAGP
ncbi:MAG: hypothetical protein HYZ53_04420 [Planctomycetes bacterium]|nr:hypothetical protein [Planctomycetota bacterium]